MGKISSSVEVANEAVSGLEKIEKPKISKINIGESNLQCMKNAAKLVEAMEQSLNELVDVTKKQADKIVKTADKKEQDDKADSLAFSASLGGAWTSGGTSVQSSKKKKAQHTDWEKIGRDELEGAGVYVNPDGSGYAVDTGTVIDNIVHNFADGAFNTYAELHDQMERRSAWEQSKISGNSEQNPLMPNKPDFDPNP